MPTARRGGRQATRRASLLITGLPPGAYYVSVNVPGSPRLRTERHSRHGRRIGHARYPPRGRHPAQHARRGSAGNRRRSPAPCAAVRTGAAHGRRQTGFHRRVVATGSRRSGHARAGRLQLSRLPLNAKANNRKDSPQVFCLPPAVLRRGPLIEFVQSSSVIVEISDDDSPGFHKILPEQSQSPEAARLAAVRGLGWTLEGDTLVVDRVNFIEDVWARSGRAPAQRQAPRRRALHQARPRSPRDRRHCRRSLASGETVDVQAVAELAPKEELREFICNENNSDLPHLVGK